MHITDTLKHVVYAGTAICQNCWPSMRRFKSLNVLSTGVLRHSKCSYNSTTNRYYVAAVRP